MPIARTIRNVASNVYGGMTRVVGGLWSRYYGWGLGRVRLLLPSARFDWEREAGDPWMNSVVGLTVSWLGDRFPRPLIHVSKIARNGDYIPVGRHPLTDLWNKPNEHYRRRTMEKAIGLSLKVDGNAYIWKVRSRMGAPVELWYIPHFMIAPTWPADGSEFIDGYRIWIDAVAYWLPASEIIHIRDGVDPRNIRLGLAALRANLREVVTVNLESSFTASILKNSGVPGLIISPEVGAAGAGLRPSPEDAKRLKEKVDDEFGVQNDKAGSVAVLRAPYKVTVVGFSPEQMSLSTLPLNAIARITSAIGVAAMSVGLPDPGKTYSNLGEANRSSWGTIVAVQELIADSLRWDLLPDFGVDPQTYTIEYDYSHVQELQEPLDAIHTRAREDYKAGLAQLNEARESVGLEPDPDGDRYFPGTGSPDDPQPDAMGLGEEPSFGGDRIPKMLSRGNGRHK